MSEPLSDERRAEIRRRLDDATPSPWEQPAYPSGTMVYRLAEREHIADCERATDADFIAHAPEDVAALLAENEQLRARVAELEAMYQRLHATASAEAERLRAQAQPLARRPTQKCVVDGRDGPRC